MKVLYILHSTIMGGATISFLNMIAGMSKRGVQIFIIIPSHDVEFVNLTNEKYGSVCFVSPIPWSICVNTNYSGLYGNLRDSLFFFPRYLNKYRAEKSALKRFSGIIEEVKPDIIHTNTGVTWMGLWAAKKYGLPHVWHLREYQDKDFGWKIFPSKKCFEYYLRKSNVITISDDLRHYFHLDDCDTAHTIYNGIMNHNESEMHWPKKNYFLMASRVSKEKGHDDVIKAFAEFYKTHDNYKLCIMGFGQKDYLDHLKALSVSLGCSEAIDWIGFQGDVKPYMRKARALIVASYFEGFGRMTAEACFMGCMVIGRNTGGTKEIIDKTGGELFETTEGLMAKMNKVADMKEFEYIGSMKKAQHIAINTFSNESNVMNIYELYEKLANKSPRFVSLVNKCE